MCTFHAQGTYKFGKDCKDKHTGGARSPSPRTPRKGKDGKGNGGKIKQPAVAAVAVSIRRDTTPSRGPGSVALAASTTSAPVENRRSWLLDTGCKFALTTKEAVPQHQRSSIFKALVPIILSTANDLVNGDKVVEQQIGAFGEVAVPYILDSTPDVLSIGHSCVEDGYEFVWRPYSHSPYHHHSQRQGC